MTGAPGVQTRTVEIDTYDAARVAAFVAEPEGVGPFPAIVFGQEAMGINAFGRAVAVQMAQRGFVTITPDYYRGDGPSKPDDYTDFTEVMAAIGALDFRQATYDVMAGADWLRAQLHVDPERVAVWGYCTGGTLAMMAACLDRRLAGAVLYFPSQPHFETIDARHPAHPVDMVWNMACPMLLIYGDEDPLMPPALLGELKANLEQWGVDHDIRIYPGASHAFTAPAPHMHHPVAAAAAWEDATAFLDERLG
jgi:carboxymethylenebutenolidase